MILHANYAKVNNELAWVQNPMLFEVQNSIHSSIISQMIYSDYHSDIVEIDDRNIGISISFHEVTIFNGLQLIRQQIFNSTATILN